jgi:hypothetical protein
MGAKWNFSATETLPVSLQTAANISKNELLKDTPTKNTLRKDGSFDKTVHSGIIWRVKRPARD